jgi:hypothetical protein
MQDSADRARWYRAEASEGNQLARRATQPFVREIYRKAAVKYGFAEQQLRTRIEGTSSKKVRPASHHTSGLITRRLTGQGQSVSQLCRTECNDE